MTLTHSKRFDVCNLLLGSISSSDPVDYMSNCTLDHIATTMIWSVDAGHGYTSAMMRLDAGVIPSDTYGMPYNVSLVAPSLYPIFFNSTVAVYQDQSDWFLANGTLVNGGVSSSLYSPAYLPFPVGMAIEGWGGSPTTDPTSGDRHAIFVDAYNCMLYESWSTERNPNSYTVANTAAFDLRKTLPSRPDTWTSADAAGLPIYPGILKYAEIQSGAIEHALRFTIQTVQNAKAFPATKGGTSTNPLEAYYGARFRLRAGFNIAGYSADTQVLLKALKKYGLILADQGSSAFITTENNPGFGIDMLNELNVGSAGPTSTRIAFTKDNWEMVQNPGPITYGYSPAPSPTCNSATGNAAPFTPSFTPSCTGAPLAPMAPHFIPLAPYTPPSPSATPPTTGMTTSVSSANGILTNGANGILLIFTVLVAFILATF